MSKPARKPIIYFNQVDIRFADLDYYGHVNSQCYLDLVATARLNFFANEMKTPVDTVAERGIGFFLIKSTIVYRKPIKGLQRVNVSSYVNQIRGGRVLEVPFTIKSADDSVTFSDGSLEYAIVDIKTQRMTIAPDWVANLFFEPLNSDLT